MSSNDDLVEIFHCSICKEKYTEQERKPTTLFPCGHTLCSVCIEKLCKNNCLICSEEFEHSAINWALLPRPQQQLKTSTTTTTTDYQKTKENLLKTKYLRNEFIQVYREEIDQKNIYFEMLRGNIKIKTDESIRKLKENEAKIMQQVSVLEKKLEEIFLNCSQFEKDLDAKLTQWEPQLEDSKQHGDKLNELNAKIKLEFQNLIDIVAKLKSTSLEKNTLNLNETRVDELFLNRLVDANNLLEKYNLEYQKLNNNNYINVNNNNVKDGNNKQTFSKQRNSLVVEFLCFKCGKELTGTYTVHNEKKYHPKCFVCNQCKHEIIENTFYNQNGSPLCRICFNVNLVENASVCFKCKQPILDTLITYKNNEYHDYCLTCLVCEKSLIGISIYSDEKRSPYCIECFTKKEGKMCSICSEHIVPSQTSFFFDQRNFHKECFKCKRCTRQINSDEIFYKSKEAVNEFICADCAKK